MKRFQSFSREKQFGAATLVIALILLIGVTVTMLYTANTSVLEQRMSANEVRAKKAAAAAQAGLDRAMLEDNPDPIQQTLFDSSTYRAVFWKSGSLLPDACPDSPGPFTSLQFESDNRPANLNTDFRIISCGWSDDRSARSVAVVQVLARPPLNPDSVAAPLVARAAVDTAGAGRVYNYFTNLTVWSGEQLSVTGNAGTTFIRNPDLPPPLASPSTPLPSTPPNCGDVNAVSPTDPYICTTRGNQAGPDVILGDPTLSGISEDDFFRFVTGFNRGTGDNRLAEFTEAVSATEVAPGDANTIPSLDSQVIVVTGDLQISGNITVGSRENPVFLIIDGNARVGGGVTFHGVVYVLGDLTTTGNADFIGTTIIEGNVERAGGTPSFIFDPVSIGGVIAGTSRGVIAGTWRDWL